MWYRAFIASNPVFLLGIFVALLGEHLLPGLSSYTLPAGALLSGMAGLVAAVSGIALILTADDRA